MTWCSVSSVSVYWLEKLSLLRMYLEANICVWVIHILEFRIRLASSQTSDKPAY